jgi:hypothetical protein
MVTLMSFHALFVEAVHATGDLPTALRQNATNVTNLEEHQFDASYIDFLDTQIRMEPRGPVWTERLRRRRDALLPFVNATLLRGDVRTGTLKFTVEVHPQNRTVIHWEEY